MIPAVCSKTYIARISNTIKQFLLLHSLQVLLFVAVINFSVLSPLKWLRSIWDNMTSGVCWLCFILNMLLLFGMSVRYSKNYTTKYLLVTSRFTKIKKLFTLNSQGLILISIVFGLSNAFLYLILTGSFHADENSDTFLQSLASNRCIIICAGPFMAVYYFIKYNFKEDVIQYPIIQQHINTQIRSKVRYIVSSASRLSMHSLLIYLVIYSICGYKATEYWNAIFAAEEISFSVLELLDKIVLVYLFTFGVCLYTTMLLMHELFVINLTRPMEFPIDEESAGEGVLLMKDALKSDIPLIKMLAFQDLCILTERNSARRREIYAITFPGGQGHNWKNISLECTAVIQKFIDGLTSTYPKLTSTKTSDHNMVGRRHNLSVLLDNSTYRAYPTQVLDNKEKPKIEMTFKESIAKKINNLPGVRYLFGDQNVLDFRQVISESQILMWTNLSLTMMLKMSLSEDEYGVTHNDFAKILELMLKLRETLTIVNKIKTFKTLSEENNLQVSITTALEVNLRSCIYILSFIYKPYIARMHLGDEIKQKLQSYNLWTEG